MATCLIGFGSNLGDREQMLRATIAEIDALSGVHVLCESQLHRTWPVGGPADQPEFLNAAAIIETNVEPLALHAELRRIETRHGRLRGQRWAARTLDIDLLLYDDRVIETAALMVPHPRMSFRRFVLEPSSEIAGEMVHPKIDWTIAHLLEHLNSARDTVAILALAAEARRELAQALTERFDSQVVESPAIAANPRLWPAESTTWVQFAAGTERANAAYAEVGYPKLSILLNMGSWADRSDGINEHGRGPTLRIDSVDSAAARADVFAAIEAVWPRLGPKGE